MKADTRRLKVLFVPFWYPPREGQANVDGTFVREHVMAVARFEDVRVLAFRKTGKGTEPSVERYDDNGVETFDVTSPYHGSGILHGLARRLLWIRSLRQTLRGWGKPDLFHCQDMASFYGGTSARLMGIPYVVSQHWTGFMKHLVMPYDLVRFRKSLTHARIVLAASWEAPGYIEDYGIRARVEWLPNTFDPELFYPGSEPATCPRLLHVSGLTEQKRVPDIIEAFRIVRVSFPQAVMHFVGDGELRVEMEALAADRLPEGSYRFPGFLPKEKVAEEMRSSRGFVFPSSAETFGCVLMEAMACGCPVLTTQVGGIPAVVRQGEGILVEVGDIDAIAEGMKLMLRGEHGLNPARISATVTERFSREVVGRQLHEAHLRASGRTLNPPEEGSEWK